MVRKAFYGVWFMCLLAVFGAAEAEAVDTAEANVTVSAPRASVGQTVPVKVSFTVPDGSHISPDAPLALKFRGPKSVRLGKAVLHYKDGAMTQGGGPVFQNQATPLVAGEHELTIDASYYVCTAELCNRQTKTLHLTLTAK